MRTLKQAPHAKIEIWEIDCDENSKIYESTYVYLNGGK